MTDAERLVKREQLASLLLDRVDDVECITVARRIAERVLEMIEAER